MGLLDILNTPEGMGLLSAVASGAAGARRGTPWNNVGRGALGGLMGYQQTKDNLAAADENAFNKQFKQLQLDQAQRAMRKESDAEAWRAGLPGLLKPQISDQGAMLNEQNAAFGDEGTQATLAAGQYAGQNAPLRTTPQVDQQAVQDYMLRPESPVAEQFIAGMVPKAPKWVMGERFNNDTGLPEKVIYDENDPSKILPFGGQKQNIPEGMRLVNGELEAIPGYVKMKSEIARAGAPQNVTYGSPTPVINPGTGEVELVQFSPTPGAAPRPTGYKPPTKGAASGPMSATLQKELIESDDISRASSEVINTLDSALALNDKAYSGVGAKERALVRSNIPGLPESAEANATVDLDNMMTGQALESLKLIFGGTPTEGERQILLDLQASADKTPAQRKSIMERAKSAAQRRGEFATGKATAIRNGTYLTEGSAPPQARPAAPAQPSPAQTKPNIQSQPMPAKPSPLTLKKGVTYQTPRGPLKWNGKAFEDAQ